MLKKHVAYAPNPAYELLKATGLRRYPQCVRENVTIMVPPALIQWLPLLMHLKLRVLMPAFTTN